MKKLIALIISVTLLFTVTVPCFAKTFTDLAPDHWAYEYVNLLVNDGTINGFEDGSFRPAGTVTRAEFVKMIGKGPQRSNGNFDDVPETHWAYEYVMTSGLGASYDNMFCPSTPITRGEVAILLWERAGSPKAGMVPPVVSNQSAKPDAASWVYANGIMTGDDYVNLRLSDTLTRAEATALIVRSRNVNSQTPQTNFYSSVDSKIFENTYNWLKVVDKPYVENATLTKGEIAMAAARLLSDNVNPDYPGVSATISFEHPYAQAVNMASRYWAGEGNDNASYADAKATVKDAILALAFACVRTSHKYVPYDANGGIYPEIQSYTNQEVSLLKIAYQNGICFNSDGKINPEKEITMKEFACLLLEFDGLSGFYTGEAIGKNTHYVDYKLNTSQVSLPSNASSYIAVIDSVPKSVYEKPYIGMKSSPAQTYAVTEAFSKVFKTVFTQWYESCKNKGVEIVISICPVLTAATDTGFTFRTKITVVNKGTSNKLSDIVRCTDANAASKVLVNGDSFWVDIDTGRALTDVVFELDDMYVRQLVG